MNRHCQNCNTKMVVDLNKSWQARIICPKCERKREIEEENQRIRSFWKNVPIYFLNVIFQMERSHWLGVLVIALTIWGGMSWANGEGYFYGIISNIQVILYVFFTLVTIAILIKIYEHIKK